MRSKFTTIQINYLLQQILAITFVCIMIFADNYINVKFKYIKIGVYYFTIITVLIYEIFINLLYKRAKSKKQDDETSHRYTNNEKFLWFEVLLLIDTLIMIAYLSVVTNIHIAILIIIGFTVFYIISMLIKPYFGIKHHK